MSDTTQENDPSIEEILASIRQIISDDDEEEASSDAKEDVVEDTPEEKKADTEEKEEDILELTEKVEEAEAEPTPEPEPEPVAVEPEPIPEPPPEPEPEENIEVDMAESDPIDEIKEDLNTEILTQGAAAATLAGFTRLTRDIQVARDFDGITLEDVVRSQLEPLLREWLDKNLPPMIEVLVEKELERLSKKALND